MDEALERGSVGRDAGRGARARFFARARTWAATHATELLAALLLAALAATLLAVDLRKSITNDEMYHVPAGYYHLVAGDFQPNNEHPPLVKMWAALPLLFMQPEETTPTTETDGRRGTETFKRFWADNRARHEQLTLAARVMMIPLALALGLAVFLFTRRLFGPRAALLALALLAVEPTLLAHARLVHTDAPAALVYLLFFIALYFYFERPAASRALLVALALSAALLTKFSMVVLLPVAALAFGVLVWRRRQRGERLSPLALHAGLVCLAVLILLNAGYYFRHPPLNEETRGLVRLLSPESVSRVTRAIEALSRVVPTDFLVGLYKVSMHDRHGHSASLLGDYRQTGWWYYFPAAFALKTTLPFLFVSVAAILYALWRLVARGERRYALVVAPLALYLASAMAGGINIGVRHLLPAFPFLFIAGGALLDRLLRAPRARPAAVATALLALVWMTFESARAFPDYVPYMNQLASARPHYQYLSDSNVEWGEDVGALCAYLRARGEREVRGAMLAGLGGAELYGVRYYEIFPKPGRAAPPETRYVAIGASFLNGSPIYVAPDASGRALSEEERVNYLAAWRAREPEMVFGGTIYLYRVRE